MSSTSTSRCTQYDGAVAVPLAKWATAARPAAGGSATTASRSRCMISQLIGQVAEVGGLLRVAGADDHGIAARDHRAGTHGPQQVRPAQAQQRADRHVGGLAGRRGAVVVGIDMAVDVDHADPAQRIAGSGDGAHDQSAAAAEQQRATALGQDAGGRRTDVGRRRAHAGPADDAADRVAVRSGDPHVEVAEVSGAEPRGQVTVPQRARRDLGPERRTFGRRSHRVDRHPQTDPSPRRRIHGALYPALAHVEVSSRWRRWSGPAGRSRGRTGRRGRAAGRAGAGRPVAASRRPAG